MINVLYFIRPLETLTTINKISKTLTTINQISKTSTAINNISKTLTTINKISKTLGPVKSTNVRRRRPMLTFAFRSNVDKLLGSG
jgi:hypothetical protein